MNSFSVQPPAHPACRIPIPTGHRRCAPAPALQDIDLTGSKGIRLKAYDKVILTAIRQLFGSTPGFTRKEISQFFDKLGVAFWGLAAVIFGWALVLSSVKPESLPNQSGSICTTHPSGSLIRGVLTSR